MKTHLIILLIGTCSSGFAQRYHLPPHDYTPQERYNDSLFIYNTYVSQIETLKNLKETDLEAWYARESRDNALIACALIRLRAYNKSAYPPDDEYNRELGGTAYHYPAPSLIKQKAYFANDTYGFRYSIIDYQTHFTNDSLGIRKIPYIIRYYYDRGIRIGMEKLNPVTFEPLQ